MILSQALGNTIHVSHVCQNINDWLHQLNTDKFIGFIILDFRKAFDILTHDKIFKKLALYGCDVILLGPLGRLVFTLIRLPFYKCIVLNVNK